MGSNSRAMPPRSRFDLSKQVNPEDKKWEDLRNTFATVKYGKLHGNARQVDAEMDNWKKAAAQVEACKQKAVDLDNDFSKFGDQQYSEGLNKEVQDFLNLHWESHVSSAKIGHNAMYLASLKQDQMGDFVDHLLRFLVLDQIPSSPNTQEWHKQCNQRYAQLCESQGCPIDKYGIATAALKFYIQNQRALYNNAIDSFVNQAEAFLNQTICDHYMREINDGVERLQAQMSQQFQMPLNNTSYSLPSPTTETAESNERREASSPSPAPAPPPAPAVNVIEDMQRLNVAQGSGYEEALNNAYDDISESVASEEYATGQQQPQ